MNAKADQELGGEWVVVPREPTPAMVHATFNDPRELSGQPESHNSRNRRIYAAMISAAESVSAAPPSPAGGGMGEGIVARSLPGGDECSLASADAAPSAAMGVEYPADAGRTYAPGLERWAENQRPKTSDHQDARLYRYVGTDLYQWYSKRGGSAFQDPFGVPFLIARRSNIAAISPPDSNPLQVGEEASDVG